MLRRRSCSQDNGLTIAQSFDAVGVHLPGDRVWCRATWSSACCWPSGCCGGSCGRCGRRCWWRWPSRSPCWQPSWCSSSPGRSLNVISLAGLAFAVGMVLDAAIVVLENIVRLREEGRSPHEGSLEGQPTQVWGALVASTATTVAIFLPVIFLKDVEGQLFADLALTIAIAVIDLAAVAVTILPTAARKWLTREARLTDAHATFWDRMADTHRPPDRPAAVRRLALIAAADDGPGRPDDLAADAQARLPAAGQARRGRRLLQLPAGGEPRDHRGRRSSVPMVERLRPYMAGEKEPALKNYYVMSSGRVAARSACARLDQSPGQGARAQVVREEWSPASRTRRRSSTRGTCSAASPATATIIRHASAVGRRRGADGHGRVRRALDSSARRSRAPRSQAGSGLDRAGRAGAAVDPNDRRIVEAGLDPGQVWQRGRASLGNGTLCR